jgi:hypothetical protein
MLADGHQLTVWGESVGIQHLCRLRLTALILTLRFEVKTCKSAKVVAGMITRLEATQNIRQPYHIMLFKPDI